MTVRQPRCEALLFETCLARRHHTHFHQLATPSEAKKTFGHFEILFLKNSSAAHIKLVHLSFFCHFGCNVLAFMCQACMCTPFRFEGSLVCFSVSSFQSPLLLASRFSSTKGEHVCAISKSCCLFTQKRVFFRITNTHVQLFCKCLAHFFNLSLCSRSVRACSRELQDVLLFPSVKTNPRCLTSCSQKTAPSCLIPGLLTSFNVFQLKSSRSPLSLSPSFSRR